jgi:ribosome-associated heat shock protein Hsp15
MGRSDDDDEDAGGSAGPPGRQRIDKWLWHARVVKTRSLAQKLVLDGHVRKNRERVERSADTVSAGDVLTVTLSRHVLVWRIVGFAVRRGSAPEAARLYEDLSPPRPPRDAVAAEPLPPTREAGSGRPTKRERRAIDRFESGSEREDGADG